MGKLVLAKVQVVEGLSDLKRGRSGLVCFSLVGQTPTLESARRDLPNG